ncbi:MAG: DUF3987 domain-containing protein, partial [Pseudomonadales bacterium]|nr:DUF3987 domain-containing protein [Pseudomonadales bacterium]
MTDYSRSNILLPSFEEAEAFLTALAGKDAPYTFQTFDDVKGRQDKTLARIYHGTFNEHKHALAALNAKGAGVYITVNKTDLKGRKEANITAVRALFVDLDGSPLQPIKDLPEDLQPHIIIESSPNKWHAYWLVDNCSLEQFKQLQQALAAKFNGDKAVNDLPRVMRLAGFSHNKGESFITRINTMQDNLYPYSVNKLIVGLGLEQAQPSRANTYTNNSYNTIIDKEDPFMGAYTQETLAELRDALRYIPANDYHEWVKVGMALKCLDNNAGQALFIEYSQQCTAKYDSQQCIAKWQSLCPSRTGYKAVFAEAQRLGWQNPAKNGGQYTTIEDDADSDEWLEPDPIIAPQEATDYPIDELPEPLRLLVLEIVDYLQCPVAMAANSVLAALSLSTQGLVNVARDNNLIGAVSLFLMVIAESGERKSACDDLVIKDIKRLNIERFSDDKKVLEKYIEEHYQIWSAQYKGLMSAIEQAAKKGEPTDELKEKLKQLIDQKPKKPRGTTFLFEDATIEALLKALYDNSPSAGIFSSEAGVVFGGHGMSKDNATRNMASLNKLWDGGDIITNRMDESKNMLLTGRRLTLCLATQASTVKAFFDNSKGLVRGIGFGARFLIAWPKSTQGTRLYKAPPLYWPNRYAFSNRIIELINTPLDIDENTGAIRPHTLRLSKTAHTAWEKFYNDTEQELRIGGELEDIKDV